MSQEPTAETSSATLVEAINEALRYEMARDDDVLVMGEDVGRNGGVFRATEDLYEEFGEERVVDTPLAESGIVGSAIGLALSGLRPVAEIQFMGFIYPAFDQLASHAARIRYRTNGAYECPLVVRVPFGAGIRGPEHHSESKEAQFVHEPGLKVVVPSTPADARGLLLAAIRDPDPVVFLEPKRIYRSFRTDVPVDDTTVPLGDAAVRREGTDVSVYTWGATTRDALEAAADLEAEVDVEVVDLRTLSPLDVGTIRDSFRKTGRAVVAHEAPRTGGFAGEVIATIQSDDTLYYQEAPIGRVTGLDTPVPLHALEEYYLPGRLRIVEAIRETVRA